MVKQIIEMLNSDEFLVGDNEIDFAKGIQSIPETFEQAKQIKKRKLHNKWLKTH